VISGDIINCHQNVNYDKFNILLAEKMNYHKFNILWAGKMVRIHQIPQASMYVQYLTN
jgi:hypothetical protein